MHIICNNYNKIKQKLQILNDNYPDYLYDHNSECINGAIERRYILILININFKGFTLQMRILHDTRDVTK